MAANGERIDAVVIGGGIAGIYALYRLIQGAAGMRYVDACSS